MNKARIVIASVLKPLTEPRAFTKLALSLRETNKYRLNIIGFYVKKTPNLTDIQFTSIFKNRRTHISRTLVSFRFLKKLFSYRPHLVIITTYELLPAAILGKLFLSYKLVYDLQENYHQNVLLNQTVPRGIRRFMALFIQAIERAAHPFISHYFFAEQSYPSEFSYIKNYTILENKYAGPLSPGRNLPALADRFTFIISGTITPVYGIEKAIQWFLSLAKERPGLKLHIIGHVPIQKFRKSLEESASQQPGIHLNLSSDPLPYPVLREALGRADAVLLPYENKDSIRFKIPTKLYECIAIQKPVLISDNPLWEKIIASYPAGLSIDFSDSSESSNHFKKLLSLPLYQNMPGQEISWEGEKSKLIQVTEYLLK